MGVRLAKSSEGTSRIGPFVTIVLLACLALVIIVLVSTALPMGTRPTYAKYGCIADDPSKREWDQFMGLSTSQ